MADVEAPVIALPEDRPRRVRRPIAHVPPAGGSTIGSQSSGLSLHQRADTTGVYKDQQHYQRSCSSNPWVATPSTWQHPINVARLTLPKSSSAPDFKTLRPVNIRGYVSPSFWVQSIEEGKTAPTASYVDYTFTDGFNRIWTDALHKEQRYWPSPDGQPAKKRNKHPSSASTSGARAPSAPATIGNLGGHDNATREAAPWFDTTGTEYSRSYGAEFGRGAYRKRFVPEIHRGTIVARSSDVKHLVGTEERATTLDNTGPDTKALAHGPSRRQGAPLRGAFVSGRHAKRTGPPIWRDF